MDGTDLSGANWRKSKRSDGQNACVEFANLGDDAGVRDSKDTTGPVLVFNPAGWTSFIAAAKAGKFNLPA